MSDEFLLVLKKVEKLGTVSVGAANTILPARPKFPDDAVVPHNGFRVTAIEKVEKGGALALADASTVFPPRPNLPDDPVIPHNGFPTVEDGEKAFTHLMRKLGWMLIGHGS